MRTATVATPRSNGRVPEPEPTVEIVNVSPEIAAEWLSQNVKNRGLRPREVAKYASDMSAGDWQWTGETIKFAADGTLLDGQHRLHAIVESGATIPILVVRGLANKAQDNIDNGIRRPYYDVLRLRGEVNTSVLAAVVRRVCSWKAGSRRGVSDTPQTNAQLDRTLEAHPELREISAWASNASTYCDLPASILGLAWWVFSEIDLEDAETFFQRFVDGQGLVKGDPIYELRRTLQGSKDVRGERSQTYLLAVTIKAWNAYRRGEQVGLLRWKAGGAKPEKFPEPI